MKLVTLSILLFLTCSAFAKEPVKDQKTSQASTQEQAIDKQLPAKQQEQPTIQVPKGKQRIPDHLDLFLPMVTNKYEPTA